MKLDCDYLVVGAGAASLAFIDTLLLQLPSAKIVVIDKKPCPGGHWVDDYDFVHLHQPSVVYGIESEQLEGNWLYLLLRKMTIPWHHRASKQEILSYYKKFVDRKVKEGQIVYYPNCEYDFDQDISNGVHQFSSLDGQEKYSVKVNVKLVNGVLGECKIPSQCPLQFPVDKDVNVLTPNDIYTAFNTKDQSTLSKKYVVLGCGKTGMDTIVYLQETMKIKPDDITWVIPNDVWMIARGEGHPWAMPEALLKHNGDEEKARAYLEEKGILVRLDKNVQPTRFRFPVIGKEELKLMRKIKNLVRKGRVTSIRLKNNKIDIGFGENQEPYTLPESANDYAFVHCTSPGPENDVSEEMVDKLFVSEKELRLHLLFPPPITASLACLAFLEAARSKGTLDLEFGRKLINARDGGKEPTVALTDNQVLHELIRGIFGKNGQDCADSKLSSIISITNIATIIALADPDPMVAFNWMRGCRLSMLSIPGFKSRIYEMLGEILEKKHMGFSDGYLAMAGLLRDKLKVLEGQ